MPELGEMFYELDTSKLKRFDLSSGDPIVFLDSRDSTMLRLPAHPGWRVDRGGWRFVDDQFAARVHDERVAYPKPVPLVELSTTITRQSLEAAQELVLALRREGFELAEATGWTCVAMSEERARYTEDCRRIRVFTRDPKNLATPQSVAAWLSRVEVFR